MIGIIDLVVLDGINYIFSYSGNPLPALNQAISFGDVDLATFIILRLAQIV